LGGFSRLVAAWASLLDVLSERAKKRRDDKKTTESKYKYGKTGWILPEICGSVRKKHGGYEEN